jgi:hypothetical protein
MRSLVWITHSFREDSRLTSTLQGECAFVYYSPYYFAGDREREIYRSCSQANLNAFYSSLHAFDFMLKGKINSRLHVYRIKDVVAHINELIAKHNFDQVVIDQPLFAMWHSIDIKKIKCRVVMVDSDLVNPHCAKMTAKSRWMNHLLYRDGIKHHSFSKSIKAFNIPEYRGTAYPDVKEHRLINRDKVLRHAYELAPNYSANRDRHDGQLQVSTALHNGVIDPLNLFYDMTDFFTGLGHDPSSFTGDGIAVIRQMCFREISIIKARRANMTLENSPIEWAGKLMHIDAYKNMVKATPNPNSNVIWDTIKAGNTGDEDLDFLIHELKETGIMPNRARMYFASKVFYESHTGVDALNSLINTFDLLGLDGQSPNNYTQVCGALGLAYGKVVKLNRNRAFELLSYDKT